MTTLTSLLIEVLVRLCMVYRYASINCGDNFDPHVGGFHAQCTIKYFETALWWIFRWSIASKILPLLSKILSRPNMQDLLIVSLQV